MSSTISKARPRGSSVSPESLEWWKNAFEIGGVILLLLTFIAGAGVLWFSKRVNAVQAEQLRQFDERLTKAHADLQTATAESVRRQTELEVEQRKTAEAQERATRVQLEYNRYLDEVTKQQKPRGVDREKFLEALRDKPKRPVVLWYNPNDTEAYFFAQMLFTWLGKGNPDREGAGWQVSAPMPILPGMGYQNSPNAPPAMGFGGVFSTFGITFRARIMNTSDTIDRETSIGALMGAIGASVTPPAQAYTFVAETDNMVLGDDIWVVIGPKPPMFFTPQELSNMVKKTSHTH
jgi:hypothetical protein